MLRFAVNMSKILFKNISSLLGVYRKSPERLCGHEMKILPVIEQAWLACEDGLIVDYGAMDDFPGITDWKALEVIDCTGKFVMPGFADSHTHIVYSGNREQEFVDRINGLTYEQVAARGGGILNSVSKLRTATEDELFRESLERLKEVIMQGTTAIEIKSGYGLDPQSEIKILRVIRRLRDLNWIPVKATFLGAHAIPAEFKGDKNGYLQMLVNKILPAIADEKLADFVDIFCEKGYFDAADTAKMLEAGAKYGLPGKVHAEQLSHTGGIAAGVKARAISVDHLEYCNDTDIELLRSSKTMATILPGAAFFLGLPFPPARKMIDAGLPIAIGSDYNPGSSPSGNMKLMMSLACIQYKLNPEEAINASTLNSAYAMQLQNEIGTITPGKRANLLLTKKMSTAAMLPYAFGSDMIEGVYVSGKLFKA
jgi:imidazolonepropionase